jgi:succinate dehydrogenase / fumarate reductase flavoprotein subunit
VRSRYENLFEMYERITGENPWNTPMRIYPAPHYTMGGLWVDYDLMTTLPGLFAIGEANFSDHGANRLGASSMMQCLADGYFVIPLTIGDYVSSHLYGDVDTTHAAFADAEREARERIESLCSIGGSSTVESLHRELGRTMWNHCGISRNADGLNEAIRLIPELRERFWNDLKLPGGGAELNQTLEYAGRLADFLEFGELMCRDALQRAESCGCHFREEHQTEEGEALRDDVNFSHVTVWEHRGDDAEPLKHEEPLSFHALPLAQRNYKT